MTGLSGNKSAKPPWGECRIESILGDLRILQADERIRISHALLEDISHPDVSYGDGILTIRAINGTISYGVGPLDPLTQTHEGHLSTLPDFMPR